MKIKAIRSYGKRLALKKPYTIAYNTFSQVHIAYVEIELENGLVGYGAGSPAEEVVGETTAKTLENLNSEFVQGLCGRDIRSFQQLIFEAQHRFAKYPGTVAALDIALHDAFGKYLGMPIAAFYGQKHQGLPTSVTIGIKDVADTLAEARDYKRQGFRVLKVKTGLDLDTDVERLVKLREAFGDYFTIRVDANQGYNLAQTRQFLQAARPLQLELVEQPMKVGHEAELAGLSDAERQKCAGDESIKDAAAALKYASLGYFGIYNIKLMKCGGLVGARTIAGMAEQAGIEVFWGCNDESRVSISAALHVAYSCPNTRYLDLDGHLDLAEDLVRDGFEIREGRMFINDRPGFGFTLLD